MKSINKGYTMGEKIQKDLTSEEVKDINSNSDHSSEKEEIKKIEELQKQMDSFESRYQEMTGVVSYLKFKELEALVTNEEELELQLNKHKELNMEDSNGITWGGADVVIAKKMTYKLISWQKESQSHVLIITAYAVELAWLFEFLNVVFEKQIDYVNKYFFYADLALAARKETSSREDESKDSFTSGSKKDMQNLLVTVLAEAKLYL
tara:strand:- start:525 stop:1145 length:621 start_codon:yes stop_codon:yes gene_type:complete